MSDPELGTAGYLPGRARLPSSSGTRHGTAATPQRFSPAPWPRRAASPEPTQSLQPQHPDCPHELLPHPRDGQEPSTEPGWGPRAGVRARQCQPHCPPAPHRHRGEQAHPGKLDKAPQGSSSKHVPHGCSQPDQCSQCRGASQAGPGTQILVRGGGMGTARLCQPPTLDGGRDLLPRAAEEKILGTSWAATAPARFPDGAKTSGSTRQSSQGGNGSHVSGEPCQLPPTAASPEGSKRHRDSRRDSPNATAATQQVAGTLG